MLTKLKDGNILGTYTPLDWDNKSRWKSDLNMFVFLYQNLKCMKYNQNNRGIDCHTDYGPYSYFFRLYKDCKMNKSKIYPSKSGFIDSKKLCPGKNYGSYYDLKKLKFIKYLLGNKLQNLNIYY